MSLVERDVELQLFDQALAGCVTGTGSAILVSGAVGAGKTELLQAFTRRAVAAGATVLTATASLAERSIPLAALGQLLVGARLGPEQTERMLRVLHDDVPGGPLGAAVPGADTEGGQQPPAPFLRELTTILLELAERAPLLLGIDDAHVADDASLHCLLYLLRRSARSRMLVVLNEAILPRQSRPMFRADLISQPHVRQVRLRPLSTCGVARLLRDELDLTEDTSFIHAFHHISGGSPMLLDALVEEHRSSDVARPSTPVVGDVFAQAVVRCLYRSDPVVLELARVLAVLDEPATPALVANLLGVDLAATQRATDTATEAGLLEGGRFRHPRAARAVLDAMTAEDRTAIHSRAAALLYRIGAPAVTVARQAIAGHHTGDSWSSPVLRDAAEHALEHNDTSLALECLRLAERGAVDELERARISFTTLRARWRLDPATAERLVDDLLDASRRQQMQSRQSLALAGCLLWYGRTDEALEVLDRIDEMARAGHNGMALALYGSRSYLAFTCPGLYDRAHAQPPPPRAALLGAAARPFTAEIAEIADGLFNHGLTDEALSAADRLLQQLRLDDETVGAIMMALGALIMAERDTAAAVRCDAMLVQAHERGAPTWLAVFSAIRAVISLRCGQLAEAERFAGAALAHIPPRSFGVFVGMPLSVLLHCATRAGRFDQAIEHLGVPVPDTLFQTTFGLHYLRARGHFYLAVGNHQAAVADFETCRDLMLRWGLDVVGLVPWRTDLAEAYLAIGQYDQARELTREQMDRLGPHNRRTLGHSLRVLAASTADERADLLRRAVEVLQDGSDQLELACARIELLNAQHGADDGAQLRSLPMSAAIGRDDVVELSEAERRVAVLAARGHTNRQIALRLHVTASTVEQHLTRVYRKLRVNRRTDLPTTLQYDDRVTHDGVSSG